MSNDKNILINSNFDKKYAEIIFKNYKLKEFLFLINSK
jgi:hypothetical protein